MAVVTIYDELKKINRSKERVISLPAHIHILETKSTSLDNSSTQKS